MSPEMSFWIFVVVATTVILSAIAVAAALTMSVRRKPHHLDVEHPIAVGRSGAPEITDPLPGPARVRRPVSEALSPAKRNLSGRE
jgi:hypothetical protein